MKEDNAGTKRKPAVIGYRNPGIALPVADILTEVLQRGAGSLLQARFARREQFLRQYRKRCV